MMSEFSRKLFAETLNSARVELSVLTLLGSDPLRVVHLQKLGAELEEILSPSSPSSSSSTADEGDHTALPSHWTPNESYF